MEINHKDDDENLVTVLWLGTVCTVQLNLNITQMCQYMHVSLHVLCVKLEHIVS